MLDFRLTPYLKLTGVIILTTHPPVVECHIVGQRDVSKERKMTQTLQNHAYIMQLVQGLMKWYFQASVGHTCCLLFINQSLTNSLRSENDTDIAKPCIYNVAGSGINEMIFPSFSWSYLMFIIYSLTRAWQKVCVVYRKYANLFLYVPKISKAYAFMYIYVSPLHIAPYQLSVVGFPCFFL